MVIPKKGDRIRLIAMNDDPAPMEPGATGTVRGVNEFHDGVHLNMEWDPNVGRNLNLCIPPDVVEVIT